MNKKTYYPIQETLYETTLSNGMEIKILPKPGFARTSVSVVVKFGSMDQTLVNKTTKETISFPEGMAHFLEHMIFESNDLNVSKEFSLLGSHVNAYTTSNKTMYYFVTTNGYLKPMRLLLDTILNPSLHEEAIQKEMQIIEKEIQMYQDDLEQQILLDGLKKMYQNHPVQQDIAGTKETIHQINEENLKLAFTNYYQPQNMILVVTGPVSPEEIVEELQNYRFPNQIDTSKWEKQIEPDFISIPSEKFVETKDIKTDLVLMAFKMTALPLDQSLDLVVEEIKYSMFLEHFFGKSSNFYEALSKAKQINNTFDYSVSMDKTYGYALFFAETKKPEELSKQLPKMIQSIDESMFDENLFLSQKRKLVGQFVQIFNSVTQLNGFLAEYASKNINVFDFIDQINRITKADLMKYHQVIQDSPVVFYQYHRQK